MDKFSEAELFDLFSDGYQLFTLLEDGSIVVDPSNDEEKYMLNFPNKREAEKWLSVHFCGSGSTRVSRAFH